MMFRVWLLCSGTGQDLQRWLSDLQQATAGHFQLVGVSDWSAAWPQALRTGQVDAVVCRLAHTEEELAAATLAGLSTPVLFVLDTPLRSPHRLLSLVQHGAVVPFHAGPDGLYAALLSLESALSRQAALAEEVHRLRQQQQRRITIEKAKALLIQQRGWSEEEAYRYLRRLARQQRRPLADLAGEFVQAAGLPRQGPRPHSA